MRSVAAGPPNERKRRGGQPAALPNHSTITEQQDHTSKGEATQRAVRIIARRHCLNLAIAALIVDLAGIGRRP